MPDVPLHRDHQDGHHDDEEEPEVVLDQKEGEAVGNGQLGDEHVEGVGQHKDERQADQEEAAGRGGGAGAAPGPGRRWPVVKIE